METQAAGTGRDPRGPADVATIAQGETITILAGGREVASVPVRDAALSVQCAIAANGSRVAAIPNYDGTAGSELLSIDVASGRTTTVASGPITSAVLSDDGGRLAYTVVTAGGDVEIRTGDGAGPGEAVASVEGRYVSLLGWSEQGDRVLFVDYPRAQSNAIYVASLRSLDVAAGTVRTLLEGNPAGPTYRDFRLVTVNGQRFVSFVEGQHVYLAADTNNTILLASLDGAIVKRYDAAPYVVRSAVWSADGQQVAFEAQAPDAGSGPPPGTRAPEAEPSAGGSGIMVANTATKEARRVVAGLSAEHRLAGFVDGAVLVGSAARGVRPVPSGGAPVAVEALEPAATRDAGETILCNNPAEYIHQVWDTRAEFDGDWSCGPTSAVTALARYVLPPWPIAVSEPFPHESLYGRYVSDEYEFNGTTFNRAMPDESGRRWQGAHGWILTPSCNCAEWARVTDFLQRHLPPGVEAIQRWMEPQEVRHHLDQGKLVLVSGKFHFGGHLSVIKGYTDRGRFVLHDTYGKNTGRTYDGQDVIYSWERMSPAQFWTFSRALTWEAPPPVQVPQPIANPLNAGAGILRRMQELGDHPIRDAQYFRNSDGSEAEQCWGTRGLYIASNAAGEWEVAGPFWGQRAAR